VPGEASAGGQCCSGWPYRMHRGHLRGVGWRRYGLRPASVTHETLGQRGTRGSLPLGRHSLAVAVLGRRIGGSGFAALGAAEAAVIEDLADGHLVRTADPSRGGWEPRSG
jgi:hypothetical protein